MNKKDIEIEVLNELIKIHEESFASFAIINRNAIEEFNQAVISYKNELEVTEEDLNSRNKEVQRLLMSKEYRVGSAIFHPINFGFRLIGWLRKKIIR